MTVTLKDISEQFTLKTALDSLSVEFSGGAIHAVIGENGAGKSTLASIISGDKQPTAGTIFLDGKKAVFKTTRDAIKRGILHVRQRPLLSNSITVCENALLGTELSASKREIKRRLYTYHASWCPDLPLKARTGDIGRDARFFTSLLGALCHLPLILLLDEPSALLSEKQSIGLYKNLQDAARGGMNIIVITHNVKDVTRFCDTVTVLKKGRLFAHCKCADYSQEGTVEKETSQKGTGITKSHQSMPDIHRDFVSFKNITVYPENRPALCGVSLAAKKGEITLIQGLPEDGLGTLENVITGMETSGCSGFAEVNDRALSIKSLTPKLLRNGLCSKIAVIPSDRNRRGASPALTVEQMLSTYYTGKDVEHYSKSLIKRAGVNVVPQESVSNLSGGMLQRLIIERELDTKPGFIVMCEPLQGLDLSASTALCNRLLSLALSGVGVIVLSSGGFPESICSSVYTLKDSHLTAKKAG